MRIVVITKVVFPTFFQRDEIPSCCLQTARQAPTGTQWWAVHPSPAIRRFWWFCHCVHYVFPKVSDHCGHEYSTFAGESPDFSGLKHFRANPPRRESYFVLIPTNPGGFFDISKIGEMGATVGCPRKRYLKSEFLRQNPDNSKLKHFRQNPPRRESYFGLFYMNPGGFFDIS